MKAISSWLDGCRTAVRMIMKRLAIVLNRWTDGRLSPNVVTIVGLLAHLPIAYLIAVQNFPLAAGLLVIFGLFDSLDGELARLQHKESAAGMLLDASTDRFKEVILYTGIAYALIATAGGAAVVWVVVACGASLCVSYVKAKGETAVAGSGLSAAQVNRLFQDGLLRFELRMFLLVVGLLLNQLVVVVVIIAVLASLTAVQRLFNISRQLRA